MITRRRFIASLGFGAGATVLNPVAESLVSEALGQPLVRKRLVFFVFPEGLSHKTIVAPPEIAAQDPKMNMPFLDGPATTTFTWPAFLKGVERYRQKILILDGLANKTGSTHSSMFGALSCTRAAEPSPSAATIDQLLAAQLSKGQPRKSVLYGLRRNTQTPTFSNHFATGEGRPEPAICDLDMLFKTLFGDVAPSPGVVDKSGIRRKLVMDGLRADIKRLQGALAGSERRKLDGYLGALEEMESRVLATRALDCKQPPRPDGPVVNGKQIDIVSFMTQAREMAATALVCGMTSVVGIAMGGGNSHQFAIRWPLAPSVGIADGHNEPGTVPGWTALHDARTSYLAGFADRLAAITEPDGKTAFHHAALFYLPENGEAHHAQKNRWPLVMFGDVGGKLKTGRFIRMPPKGGRNGYRSLADFFQTVGEAVGVPLPEFGKVNGAEPVKGPIAELLV